MSSKYLQDMSQQNCIVVSAAAILDLAESYNTDAPIMTLHNNVRLPQNTQWRSVDLVQ